MYDRLGPGLKKAFFGMGLLLATGCSGLSERTYKVSTVSMEPTLRQGTNVRAQMLEDNTLIKRGDIIVFKVPNRDEVLNVKRVISIGGDVIRLETRNVYLNGRLHEEPYAIYTDQDISAAFSLGSTTISENFYFVMGDNRDLSIDSRHFGPISREDIIGLVIAGGRHEER